MFYYSCSFKIVSVFFVEDVGKLSQYRLYFFLFFLLGKWFNYPSNNLWYRASFLSFADGSEPNRFSALILFINVSETRSATPSTVDFGMTSGSSLKFATITYVRVSGITIFRPPCCGDGVEACRMASPTRLITLVGSIPWIGMWAGSTHNSEGMSRPFSIPSLAVVTFRHCSATVMFSIALTRHSLCFCAYDSGWRSSGPFSIIQAHRVSCSGGFDLFSFRETLWVRRVISVRFHTS